MNGEYGKWHTKGLQEGEDGRYVKVAVTLKHWDAYSLEDSDGFTRDDFNAVVRGEGGAWVFLGLYHPLPPPRRSPASPSPTRTTLPSRRAS